MYVSRWGVVPGGDRVNNKYPPGLCFPTHMGYPHVIHTVLPHITHYTLSMLRMDWVAT